MMNSRSIKRAALAGALLWAGSAHSQSMQVEHVGLGSQDYVQLDARPTRVALGDPSVVNLRLLKGNRMRLVGLKAGTTNITVWTKESGEQTYSVVVGPDVAVLNSDMSADPALKNASAVSTPFGVSLEGHASNLDARGHALSLARSHAEKPATDDLGVNDRRMVAIEVRFAAVSTSTMKSLGINFTKLGSGMQFATGVPGSISSATLGQNLSLQSSLPISQAFNLLLNWPGSDLGTAISALSSVNLAQLLAEPTLMVRSGDQADFLAGGEIPIPITQSGAVNGAISIEYKKFGVQLHVRATVLSENRIVLRVNPEVSELDNANALTLQGFNVPAIRVRSADTNIELGNGQSFVIAGLMFSNHANIEEKVPGLGDLPVVGDFFKRSQNSDEEQELIIVATPRLVSPMVAASVPKLPGEGFAYAPTGADVVLNARQLDDFVADYGLAP
ncbi:MAG TPA: pilus assembly protein N-terminal domain-containing protein [Rhizomicrobium sp.]|nr:pilus assembly protein N-terminal domain-containing protein [Rhizomicrobium sp.]